MNLKVKGKANVKVKHLNVKVKGKANVKVKHLKVKVKGKASFKQIAEESLTCYEAKDI